MIVQVLDKFGKAVARRWFMSVENAWVWLDAQYPHRDQLGYSIEIFYE